MEKRFDDIYQLLLCGKYPEGYNKSMRQTLRRHACKFRLIGEELYYGANRRAIKSQEEAFQLFKTFHIPPTGLHHGIVKTRTSLCTRFYWFGMSMCIDKWIVECEQCQKCKKPFARPSLNSLKVSGVWEVIGIELEGPLPETCNGHQYILTVIDYYSKWVEACPLKTNSAVEVAQKLCTIFYRQGFPKRILSMQESTFLKDINLELCKLLSTECSVHVACYLQAYSLDAKTNERLKRALKKLVITQQNNWDVFLDATLFSLRSKVNSGTKYSPFFLLYRRDAMYPSEIPMDLSHTTITLPDENEYSNFVRNELEISNEDLRSEDHVDHKSAVGLVGEDHVYSKIAEDHVYSKSAEDFVGKDHVDCKSAEFLVGEDHVGSKSAEFLVEDHADSKCAAFHLGDDHLGSKSAEDLVIEELLVENLVDLGHEAEFVLKDIYLNALEA